MYIVFNKGKWEKYSSKETYIKKVVLRINPEYTQDFDRTFGIKNSKYELPKNKKEFNEFEWTRMPEFDNTSNGEQFCIVEIYFKEEECIANFNKIALKANFKFKNAKGDVKEIQQGKTDSLYYPEKWGNKQQDGVWTTKEKVKPTYSLNILSLGRFTDSTRLTSKTLEEMDMDYRIFVEPFEYNEYIKVINAEKVVKLPDNYHTYERGGIPARNFIKWYSTNVLKEKKHWILDDNIRGFYRFHNNRRLKIKTGWIFKNVEQYCERYTNVGIAGFTYYSMVPEISVNRPPIVMNGKVFSCILITNDSLDWEGKYNEDIDLSLRLLKQGKVNLEFNHILIFKPTSGTMKGGNKTTIYRDNNFEDEETKKQMGYKNKVDYIIAKHPDVRITYKKLKSKEYHHSVDYSPFKKNKLERVRNYDKLVKKQNFYELVLSSK